jgi:carboxyl-terminal processing protease
MRKCYHLGILVLCLTVSLFSNTLRLKDIHPIAMQMLAFHAEHNTLDETIVRRTVKLYIDQFDNMHTYLLQSEVKDYLNMSDKRAREIAAHLMERDYTDFEDLNKVIQNSITRARGIRAKVLLTAQANNFAIDRTQTEPFEHFPKSIAELSSSIQRQVQLWINAESMGPHYALYSPEEKVKAFQIWERRQERHENLYLFVDAKGNKLPIEEEDHYFSESYLKSFSHGLDAHTAYFSRDEVNMLRVSLQKQFKGVGVVIRESGKGPYIAKVMKGGPAFRSKRIYDGDLLKAIDGDRLDNLEFDQILKKMEGKDMTKVVLTLQKPDADTEYDVVLRREKITMDEGRLKVTSEPYGDGIIGIVSYDTFYDNGGGITTDKDLRKAISQLRAQGELKGLVMDIRNNSGGFLSQAVKVAGIFIPQGIIAIAKYSNGEIHYSRDMDAKLQYDGPLVVLTSKGSASAAEVVAQAIQDYNAGVIVGDPYTYGKGTMQFQNITDPKAQHYFKVTVGRYYTVSGRSPQLIGVKADIVVESQYAPYNIGERFLLYPIPRAELGFSFTDPNNPLRQISGVDKQQLYSSFFPNQRLKWKAIQPQLQVNSQKRLEKNSDYQAFLNKVDALKNRKKGAGEMLHGMEDLQMAEAVNIVKDMIAIEEIQNSAPHQTAGKK